MKFKISVLLFICFLLAACSSTGNKEITFIEDYLTMRYTTIVDPIDFEEIEEQYEVYKLYCDDTYLESYYTKRLATAISYRLFGQDISKVDSVVRKSVDVKKISDNNFTYMLKLEATLKDGTVQPKELSGTITLNKDSRKIQFEGQ